MTATATSEAAMEAAERFVMREMLEQLQIPSSRARPWVDKLALAISAFAAEAVRRENEECEQVALRVADDHGRLGSSSHQGGAESAAEAIAARRQADR